jgi:DNA repair protein RecO (recombination protein O)
MNWEDECYLLSKRKFRENANIINVFTKSKGKVSGVVYGGNSRKIRNYLQLSNKLFVIYNSKNENKAGYFKTELIKPVSPSYFNDKKRTSALISLCSILNILLPELQPNENIFKSFEKFIESLNLDNWIILYIFFELNLIKNLGYDPNLSKFKNDVTNEDEIKKIKIESFYYEVPEYLISKKIPDKASNYLIKKSLYFTRHIIQNRFFIPNNLTFPKSRILFESYFN